MSYKNAVCRGSWALRNNCRVCERCVETRPANEPSVLEKVHNEIKSQLTATQQDLNQAREEIEVLKAKLEKVVELATILDNNASHDCWPVKPEGCTCYLGDVRKQLNSITIDSIKRGE